MTHLIKPSLVNCSYEDKYRRLFWENRLFQTPWMIIKLLAGLFVNLIIYLFFLKTPTDKDIVNFVENTTLALLLDFGSSETASRKLEMEDCEIKSCLPSVALGSFKMIFKKHPQGRVSIELFQFNGRIITNRILMMEIIFFFHTASFHTNFHLYSNSLTEYIVDNNISLLLPSTKTSLPLHHTLTKQPISPVPDAKTRTENPWIHRFITRVYSVDITRESLIEESLKPYKFKDLSQEEAEESLPLVGYLAECRIAVKKALNNAALPDGLLEPLFYHMIVHAVDHASCYAQSWNLKFGVGEFLDGPCSQLSIFRSLMFRWLMVKPSIPPVWSNKIKYIRRNPCNFEISETIKHLDVKYQVNFADKITASVMY